MGRLVRKLITAGLTSILLGCPGPDKISAPPPPSRPPVQPPPQNRNPVITSSPVIQVDENNTYNYQIQRSDPDGDNTTCTVTGPGWLSMSENCLVQGIAPEVSADQNFNATVTVSDGRGGTASQNYTLTVKNLFNIHALSAAQTTGLTVTDTNLIFSQPVNFAVGDVVSSSINSVTPSGLLRQINSISSDRRTITTRNAVLEDIVREANISSYNSLSPLQVRSFTGLRGVSMIPSATNDPRFKISLNNVVLYDYDGNRTTTNDQIIANGFMNFDAGFNFDLTVKNSRLESLLFEQILNESTDITIGANLLAMAVSYKIKIAEYRLAPIVVATIPTTPPIPLIITPKIEVYAGINLVKANPLSFRVRQDLISNSGLQYNNGAWSPIARLLNSFNFTIPAITGEWSLNVFAGPTLKLPLYDIAGPSVSATVGMTLQTSNSNWELHGNFNASAAISAEILSHVIASYSLPIVNFDTLLARGSITSPADTNKILFVSGPEFIITPADYPQMYTIRENGTNLTKLTNFQSIFSDYEPRTSPDGQNIVYVSVQDGNPEIYRRRIDGTDVRRLTFNSDSVSNGDYSPDWSPDGTQLVFVSNRSSSIVNKSPSIYLMNADGTNQRRLTLSTGMYDTPRWSPDGAYIAFSSTFYDPGRDRSEIFIVNKTGTETRRVTYSSSSDPAIFNYGPSWSPDESRLVFTSYRNGNREIYSISASGTNETQLTNDPAIDADPFWMPNGKIVFISNRVGGYNNIHIMDSNGSNVRRIVTLGNYTIDRNPTYTR